MNHKTLTRYANSKRLLFKVGALYYLHYLGTNYKVIYTGSVWNPKNELGLKKHWYHSFRFYYANLKKPSAYETFIKDSEVFLITKEHYEDTV